MAGRAVAQDIVAVERLVLAQSGKGVMAAAMLILLQIILLVVAVALVGWAVLLLMAIGMAVRAGLD
jgi:hypothetical protein